MLPTRLFAEVFDEDAKAVVLSQLIVRVVGVAVMCVSLGVPSSTGQEAQRPRPVDIPAGATSLEGIPTVRIDSAEGQTTRRVLDTAEAAKSRLTVRVIDGQFYWATRGNQLLRLNSSGDFTYLSSEPGQYHSDDQAQRDNFVRRARRSDVWKRHLVRGAEDRFRQMTRTMSRCM